MEGTTFGVDESVVEEALKKGIKVLRNGSFSDNPGQVSLLWHPSLQRWCFAYGTSAADAGFALLEDYGRLWKLR